MAARRIVQCFRKGLLESQGQKLMVVWVTVENGFVRSSGDNIFVGYFRLCSPLAGTRLRLIPRSLVYVTGKTGLSFPEKRKQRGL